MARRASRILWVVVFLLGGTLVFWGLIQNQEELTYDVSFLHKLDLVHKSELAATTLASFQRSRTVTKVPAAAVSFAPVPGGTSPKLRPPRTDRIWPTVHEREDRILAKINLIPANPRYDRPEEEKLILIYNGFPHNVPVGKGKFQMDRCPVQNCHLTEDRKLVNKAHAIVFEGGIYESKIGNRPPGQIWIIYLLESPENIADLRTHAGRYNWTATYRLDSTINTPYERFISYANISDPLPPPSRNYAEGKTKLVAWFVSNCYATNRRGAYAKELQKYISVDIYGACGNLTCFRSDEKRCYTMLKQNYKFYLAFENSNCRDYITEKFYWNALYNDVIPIVMGARPEDYAAVAPPGSYIHVDDFESPRHLAEYLNLLDKNDTLYNEYFRWKGTGEFIDTKYWCRLCSLVHESYSGRAPAAMWYGDIGRWWNGPGVCIRPRHYEKWASWRHHNTSIDDAVVDGPNTLNVIHRPR